MREAEAAIAQLDQIHGRPTKRAELLLTAARSALAAGEPATALAWATEARQLFDRQGRRWWRAHADLARVSAGIEAGPATAALLRDAQRCVRELSDLSSPDQPLARLATGRVALALGRMAVANEQLVAAAAGRRHGPPLSRAVAWLAEALRAEAVGDSQRLMYACRRGLDVIDEYRSMLGSSELRAQTTAHGAELANLGQRHALRLGRPRLHAGLERAVAGCRTGRASGASSRRRGTASRACGDAQHQQPSSPRARTWVLQTGPLRQERQRLERAVRARALRTLGAGRRDAQHLGTRGFVISALLDELGNDRLLELVDIDGQLHVLACGEGRVRLFTAGSTEQAAREVTFARFMLRRLAVGPTVPSPADVNNRLRRMGETLEQVLLGGAGDLGDGKVIVVPPGRLHAVPWGLLPQLRSRAVSVVPSASSWLRAHRAAAGDGQNATSGSVVLVRGPAWPRRAPRSLNWPLTIPARSKLLYSATAPRRQRES